MRCYSCIFRNPVWAVSLLGAAVLPVFLSAVPRQYLTLEEAEPADSVRLSNHYDFPVRDYVPIPMRRGEDGETEFSALSRQILDGALEAHYLPVQAVFEEGEDLGRAWIEVYLRPGESRTYQLEPTGGGNRWTALEVSVESEFPGGLPAEVTIDGSHRVALFDLGLVEIFEDLDGLPDNRENRLREAVKEVVSERRDTGDKSFEQLERQAGSVRSQWVYEGNLAGANDYGLRVTYAFYSSGSVEVEVRLSPREISRDTGYLALAKLVDADPDEKATIRWKGKQLELDRGEASPPRTNRMHSWSRDVNWLGLRDEGEGMTRAILADFAPNLTRFHEDRYRNANDYLVNEYVVGTDDGWAMLSEIARENAMSNYIPSSYVIPETGEEVVMNFRILPPDDVGMRRVDEAFIGYAGYRSVRRFEEALHYDFGVDGVRFGTNYFPHSTFGENFEHWRSAGLRGDRWWPVFGDSWRFFKDGIRRDLRIARSLGLDWIRIHHFDGDIDRADYLLSAEGEWMLEYLDFLVRTAEKTGLRLFLDFALSPEDAARVAEKYGETIRFFEIQNEALLLGITPGRADYWKEVGRKIREVRPDASVFVTGGPMFTSLYDRLEQLGVEADAIGQHAYVDRRQAPEYVKDIALGVGGYATGLGKMPLNSEFNWRMITRDSEQEQADHFYEITDNLLSQRALPLLLQFQFIETLAVPPRTRGALRHYELLRLDRTPKPQAGAFTRLVREYSVPEHRIRQFDLSMPSVDVTPGELFMLPVTVTNYSGRRQQLVTRPVLPDGFTSETPDELVFELPAYEQATIRRQVRAGDAIAPGVYHFFEEVDWNDERHYAWGQAHHRKSPRLDLDSAVLEGVVYAGGIEFLDAVDLSGFKTVVFGKDAPALEVDWALYLYNTLRSATGARMSRHRHDQVDAELKKQNLLLLGRSESNPLIAELEEKTGLPVDPGTLSEGEGAVMMVESPFQEDRKILLVTGGDARGVEKASSDLIFRYWRHAKEAVSFREGMDPVESEWYAVEEPERPGSAHLVIEGPAEARVGDEVRFAVLTATEPPSPAGEIRVRAVTNDGTEIDLGTTGSSGELSHRFEQAGDYRVELSGDRAGEGVVIQVRNN